MDRSEKWYEYKPEAMIEKDWFKILWDFKIQVKIYLSIEDLILSWLKGNKKSVMVDIASTGDQKVQEKQQKKTDNYQDLKTEIART